MGNLGFQEIILIFIIALIFFGPRKLPEIGKTIGKSLAEFRKATNELRNTWEEEVRKETEGLQAAVGTSELSETYSQTGHDSYSTPSYDDGGTYSDNSGSTGEQGETYNGTDTLDAEQPVNEAGADGRLEPNSTLENDAEAGADPAANSEAQLDPSQPEPAAGAASAR